MSWISRFSNLFRRNRLDRELEEELTSHIEEAIEQGRSPEEARRAFGATIRHREASRDLKLIPWLDSLAADVVFGWRQLNKHRSATAAAILSLALAIGATTAAFRLVDAVLLRPLPIRDSNHLYYFATTYMDDRLGHAGYRDDSDYPTFREYRQVVSGKAELILAGNSSQQDTLIGASDQIERPFREFVSGNFFTELGIRPAFGRLLMPNDDVRPGGHPVAVIGYSYWTSRFARDPRVIGQTFRYQDTLYQIVGVAAKGFDSTEPGTVTDIYIPAAMNVAALNSRGWSWFRILLRPKSGVSIEQVRQVLQAKYSHDMEERAKLWNPDTPKKAIAEALSQSVLLMPAAGGASQLQKEYRRPLLILSILVILVLLVACANVGNLLSAQAAARAREMALRVSIGAGRRRLVQMVLVESALLAAIASAAGALFSWWSAPFVVSLLAPPQQPVRLTLGADWRVVAFGIGLTVVVALFFGAVPALRASSAHPINALRGSEDLHVRRGLMHSLAALQVAFCVLVLFVAGLFVGTFRTLVNRSLGYSPQHVLALQVRRPPGKQPADISRQLAGQLPGVESASLAGWTLMSGNHWTVTIRLPASSSIRNPYCLNVSPDFFPTMGIPIISGRDFRAGEIPPGVQDNNEPVAGVGIVNEAFARAYFGGQDPVGRNVPILEGKDVTASLTIVGYVRDAVYSDVRETIRPTVYVPARSASTLLLRTAAPEPMALVPLLRREIPRLTGGYTVGNIQEQVWLVRAQMVREKLLATLSFFFAIVALTLAAVGLYGVLNFSAVQQRREIGIRMALGARPFHVVRRITAGIFGMILLGAAAGLAGGLACGRFVETLLFGVKTGDLASAALPILTLLAAAVAASIPPVVRAVRLDPSQVLRD